MITKDSDLNKLADLIVTSENDKAVDAIWGSCEAQHVFGERYASDDVYEIAKSMYQLGTEAKEIVEVQNLEEYYVWWYKDDIAAVKVLLLNIIRTHNLIPDLNLGLTDPDDRIRLASQLLKAI